MSLFKTGDVTHDQYATFSTEQLVQIVTDTTGRYQPEEVDTARRILLVRGFDYRTKEQKAAEITAARAGTTTAFTQPPVRRQSQPANKSGLKAWHWIWIILATIRMIGCLMRHR